MARVDAFFHFQHNDSHWGSFLGRPINIFLTFMKTFPLIVAGNCFTTAHFSRSFPSIQGVQGQLLNKVGEAFERGDPESLKARPNVLHVVLDIVYGHEHDLWATFE